MTPFFILRESFGHLTAGEKLVEDSRDSGLIYVHTLKTLLPSFPVPVSGLLPFQRFLLNRPQDNYWALRRRLVETSYLSRPYHDEELAPEYGPVPFHFDSLGELVFYLRRIKHKSSDYLICHHAHAPNLVT